jgi:hypothetical protein
MYRQGTVRALTQADIGNEGKLSSPTEQRKNFAKSMNACIKRTYGGKVPSYSVIARDFSLRYPQAGSISGESIRKWMTGRALPQSHRLSALVDWLGSEIATALSLNSDLLENKTHLSEVKEVLKKEDVTYFSLPEKNGLITSDTHITQLIQNLSCRDRKIMLSILRTLQSQDSHDEK